MTVLVQATEKLGKGSLGYRIEEDLKHEFKQLADSFNGMATALQKQRDELESVRQLYQALFNCAGDGIFILDLSEGRQGDIVSANPAAAVMHGYATDELGKMNIADLTHDEKCPERLQCALPGSWGQYEIWRRRKNGSTFLAEVNLGQLEVQERKYAIAFSRDITQRREEEKKLQRANHLAAVGEMAAGLAHEIKNPLAGIKVSLEVLAEELDLSEEDSELFVRLVAETQRVEKLLKGLLNYARPPKLQYGTFDLAQLINNVIKNLSSQRKNGDRQNFSFVCDFADDLPLLEADSAQLQQVILNILLNAIEAMPDGGQVKVTAVLHGADQVLMTFTDQGIGLPADKREAVFQPFYTSKNKGTGLGLAISQRIIEEHHGSISAADNAGGGTVFSIVLPLSRNRQDNHL
jgi:two-component system sensor histidine kinase AtoS